MASTGWDWAASRSRAAYDRIRRATHAEGAGESGLAKLIELNAANSAGDALVAVALAGTLFFSVPTGQARGRVALYLLVTMAPFCLIAPVIGPVLDRFRNGRRIALATTMWLRTIACFLMASALSHHHPIGLYPGAFAILVLSRAYGVSRSAVLPRLLPKDATLVRSNARVSLAGTTSALAVGAFGALVVAVAGARWSLGLASIVFIAGGILALRLPRHADSDEGEQKFAPVTARRTPHPRAQVGDVSERPWWVETEPHPEPGTTVTETAVPDPEPIRGLGPAVTPALRANAALRAYSGFLTIYIAFLVHTHDLGPHPTVALGFVAISAAVGGVVGQGLGARLHGRAPQRLVFLAIATATGLAIFAGVAFSLTTLAIVAFAAGAGQSVAKLSLDSVIQKHIPEEARTAAFARSETVLQLSFVVGGAIGLVPIDPTIAMLFASAGLAAMTLDVLRRQRRAARAERAAA